MYDLPYHKEKDPLVIRDFMARYPFAFLSGCDAEHRPVATQVPVLVEEQAGKLFLQGHLMKRTDHHEAFLRNGQVLAVFSGPQAYVSATWYSNPHIASTWSYMSVYATGLLRFLDDAGLEDVLQRLSLHFENSNHESPTVFANLPLEFKQRVMRAIAAFEIEVKEIDTVFKLSQDKDAQSYQSIIEQLKGRGENGNAIAMEMEKRRNKAIA